MRAEVFAAFPGTGKTHICKKTNIDAAEIEYWKYKESGLKKEYVQDLKQLLGKLDYVFIATDPEGLLILKEECISFVLVYPKNELRNEYLDRYIERDSDMNFIGAFMKYWDTWLNELKDIVYCKHIVLDKGQFLDDVI